MSFEDSIIKIIDHYGIDILTQNKLIYIIADLNGFKEFPAAQSILKELIQTDMIISYLNGDNSEKSRIKNKLISIKGYNESYVNRVLNIIEKTNSPQIQRESSKENSETSDKIEEPVHLSFWGLEMGKPASYFKEEMGKRGYFVSTRYDSKEKRTSYSCTIKRPFLGHATMITIYECPISSSVYKIELFLTNKTFDNRGIYLQLYPLLINKYGQPYKDDKIDNRTNLNDNKQKGVAFRIDGGTISLMFRTNGFLLLDYQDECATKLNDSERQKLNALNRTKKKKNIQNQDKTLLTDIIAL